MYNPYFIWRAFREKRNSRNGIENEVGKINNRKIQILLSNININKVTLRNKIIL